MHVRFKVKNISNFKRAAPDVNLTKVADATSSEGFVQRCSSCSSARYRVWPVFYGVD